MAVGKNGMCCNHSPEDGSGAKFLTVRTAHVLAPKGTLQYDCVCNIDSIGGIYIYIFIYLFIYL
jgi:hypothetical protein